jgi:hypothetical protein
MFDRQKIASALRVPGESIEEHGTKEKLTCCALGNFDWLIISRKRQRKRRDSFRA